MTQNHYLNSASNSSSVLKIHVRPTISNAVILDEIGFSDSVSTRETGFESCLYCTRVDMT